MFRCLGIRWDFPLVICDVLLVLFVIMFVLFCFLLVCLSLKQITQKTDYRMQQQDTIIQYKSNIKLKIQSTLRDL